MPRDIIRFENVSKNYGNVTALNFTDLGIEEGEFFTLLGPSGSGKTTILNLIAGSILPSTGRILLSGKDVTKVASSDRELGMVFQNYALMPHMTVFDNVAFPLTIRRLPREKIQEKVRAALEKIRLPNIAKRFPKELSGGQQQRVALARCLVYDPKIILMDEPLSALDRKLRDQMQIEIKHLHRELKTTIVYVTHDQGEALALSDRICLMNSGQIEQLGTPNELYFQPKSLFAADFIGESNIFDATVDTASETADLKIMGILPITGVANNHLTVGQKVKVMIRPESLALDKHDVGKSCVLKGEAEEVVLIGGVTEIRMRTAANIHITSRTLTSRFGSVPHRGDLVELFFNPRDVTVLL